MAEKPARKKRVLKKVETVRERSVKPAKPSKTRKLSKSRTNVSNQFKKIYHFGKKEYYLPIPETKLGKFLNKRRSFIPKYFINSFNELKQVEWPTIKTTRQLSIAVFIFAIFFSILVSLLDSGLDRLFKLLIVK